MITIFRFDSEGSSGKSALASLYYEKDPRTYVYRLPGPTRIFLDTREHRCFPLTINALYSASHYSRSSCKKSASSQPDRAWYCSPDHYRHTDRSQDCYLHSTQPNMQMLILVQVCLALPGVQLKAADYVSRGYQTGGRVVRISIQAET